MYGGFEDEIQTVIVLHKFGIITVESIWFLKDFIFGCEVGTTYYRLFFATQLRGNKRKKLYLMK